MFAAIPRTGPDTGPRLDAAARTTDDYAEASVPANRGVGHCRGAAATDRAPVTAVPPYTKEPLGPYQKGTRSCRA